MSACYHDANISFCSTHGKECKEELQYPTTTSKDAFLEKEALIPVDQKRQLIRCQNPAIWKSKCVERIADRCFELHLLLVCLQGKARQVSGEQEATLSAAIAKYKEEERTLREEAAGYGIAVLANEVQVVFNKHISRGVTSD